MTNEEAIKILKSKMDGSVDTSYEWAETMRMAINALEKQIPMKPVKSKEERYGMGYVYHDWICPTCGRFLAPEPTRTGNRYCRCGQAIDWEGELIFERREK